MLAKYGQSWILFAFVSAVGWGVWGFFSAKASKGTSPVALWATVVVIEGIVALPVFLKYRPVLSTFAGSPRAGAIEQDKLKLTQSFIRW